MSKGRADRTKDMRARREAAGLCVECGKVAPEPDKVRCHVCLEKRNGYQKARRDRRVASGQCVACNNPAVEGGQFCADHKKAAELYHSKYRRKAK